jgi:hypothetical protein
VYPATTQAQAEPLDKRRREAHPERIEIGGELLLRQDILANEHGESERSINRRDPDGAPYIFLGGVKYRPKERYERFILSRIQQARPSHRRSVRR